MVENADGGKGARDHQTPVHFQIRLKCRIPGRRHLAQNHMRIGMVVRCTLKRPMAHLYVCCMSSFSFLRPTLRRAQTSRLCARRGQSAESCSGRHIAEASRDTRAQRGPTHHRTICFIPRKAGRKTQHKPCLVRSWAGAPRQRGANALAWTDSQT